MVQVTLAAIKLDDREIAKLLEQIPENRAFLRKALTNLVNNIRFDTIVELTESQAENG